MDREKIWTWIEALTDPAEGNPENRPPDAPDDDDGPLRANATGILPSPDDIRRIQCIVDTRFSQLRQLRNYRRHAFEIALGASLLARAAGESEQGCRKCAMAGYVHDVGKLAVAAALSRRAGPLHGTPWRDMQTVLQQERENLGTDHAETGTKIAEKLAIEPELLAAIAHHHDPDQSDDVTAGFVFLAHFLTFDSTELARVLELLPMDLLGRLNLSVLDFLAARDQFMARQREELVRH